MEQPHEDDLGQLLVVLLVALLVELLHGRRHAQPVADGGSHALRDGIRVIETGFVTGDAQRDGLARRQIAFPGQAPGKLAQFLETDGAELAEPHQQPVRSAQMEIGAIDGGAVAGESHAAGFNARGVRCRQQAEGKQLLCGAGRQSRGNDGKEISHGVLLSARQNRPRILRMRRIRADLLFQYPRKSASSVKSAVYRLRHSGIWIGR